MCPKYAHLSVYAETSKGEWRGPSQPSPDEIVGGALYPSCIACHEGHEECFWEFRCLRVRMQGYHSTEPKCERCRLGEVDCRFAWGFVESLARLDGTLDRLVVHAGSDYRKTGRRIEAEAEARKSAKGAVQAVARKTDRHIEAHAEARK